MSDSVEIDVTAIQGDAGAQMRVRTSDAVVAEYAEAINAGAVFPPIVVFHNGGNYWLADGFHRLAAQAKLGYETIPVDVRKGGRRDAIQYSLGANETHGLRRTREDKQRAVATALADPEWSALSDRDIAQLCGVSHTMVSRVRKGGAPEVERPKAVWSRETRNVATAADSVPEELQANDLVDSVQELAVGASLNAPIDLQFWLNIEVDNRRGLR